MNNPPSLNSAKTVQDVYDQWGTGFDDLVATTPFLMNCTLLYNHCLKKLCQTVPMAHVLDAGCGSGVQSFYLGAYAKRVTGMDLSLQQIEIAAKRCAEWNHVRFHVGNACQLPYKDKSFDCIVSYGDVISHIVEGYGEALAEIARVAQPGAILTFEVDTKWNLGILYHPRELLDALLTRGIGHATRVWEGMRFKTFTYRELQGLLKKLNFEIVGCYGHNIFASLIPDRYLLEHGRRSFWGKVALWLGRLDLRLSGIYPFNRFGFNFIIMARKNHV